MKSDLCISPIIFWNKMCWKLLSKINERITIKYMYRKKYTHHYNPSYWVLDKVWYLLTIFSLFNIFSPKIYNIHSIGFISWTCVHFLHKTKESDWFFETVHHPTSVAVGYRKRGKYLIVTERLSWWKWMYWMDVCWGIFFIYGCKMWFMYIEFIL